MRLTLSQVLIGIVFLLGGGVGQTAPPEGTSARPELVLQTGHTMRVNCVTFGADNRWLATGGADNLVKVWDAGNGRELRALKGHTGWINALAASPTGELLASGGNDLTIRIWTVANGEGRLIQTGHTKAIEALAFGSEGRLLASGSDDGTIKVWEAASGRLLQTFPGHDGNVTHLTFSIDGKILASAGTDNVVKTWDVSSWRAIRMLRVSAGGISALAFDAASQLLGIGSADGSISVWHLNADRPSFVARHNHASVLSLFFKADHSLVAATADGAIVFWNVSTGKLDRALDGQSGADELIVSSFSRAGDLVAQGPGSRNIDLRLVSNGNVTQTLTARSAGLYAVANSGDGRWLASAANDRSVRLWQTATGREMPRLTGHTGVVSTVAFSRDSKYLVSGSIAGEVKLWDLEKGREAFSLPLAQGGINSVAFSPDGKLLAAAGVQQSVQLWDLETRRPRSLVGHSSEITSVAFSPDGNFLVSGSADKTIRLWNVKTAEPARAFAGFNEQVNATVFSADGKFLVAGGSNGRLQLWEIASGLPAKTLTGHTGDLLAVAFSPDGQLVASTGTDRSVRLWRVQDGAEVARLNGSASAISGLTFTVGGRWLIGGADDGAMMIWNVESRTLAATLISVRESDDWLVVTPDGLFDGSPPSWNLILWRFAGDTFSVLPVEAYFNEFFFPGLLADLLADKNPKATQDITQKDRRQPLVNIIVKGSNDSEVAARELTLRIEITDASSDKEHTLGCGARDLRLFRNGLLVKSWSGDVLKGAAKQSVETTIPVVAGENRLSAYAFNHDNIKSVDAGLILSGADSLKRSGSIYVLAIGVGQYENSQFNLNYPVADATEVGSQLKDQQERLAHYSPIVTIPLYNSEATKANIMLALARLTGTHTGPLPGAAAPALAKIKPAQPEDAVVIYFSGHGTAVDNRFYLIPHDLGFQGPRNTLDTDGLKVILGHSISDRELEEALKPLDADQLLLVIDACNSGQALKSDKERRGPMNARGLAQLAYEKGMYILTASQSDEVAFESAGLKHSYLAYALVEEGLKLGAADIDHDGQILLQEWFAYATERVPRMRREISAK